MKVKKMSLAWITVSDVTNTQKFFTETIGLKVSSSAPEHGWLELTGEDGGMILGVGQAGSESSDKPGVNAVVTMTVDDIIASKAEMESKGVLFIGEIIEVPGHVKMATFLDPDGNMFQLVQEIDQQDQPPLAFI